jgi:hypothetical protein
VTVPLVIAVVSVELVDVTPTTVPEMDAVLGSFAIAALGSANSEATSTRTVVTAVDAARRAEGFFTPK